MSQTFHVNGLKVKKKFISEKYSTLDQIFYFENKKGRFFFFYERRVSETLDVTTESNTQDSNVKNKVPKKKKKKKKKKYVMHDFS